VSQSPVSALGLAVFAVDYAFITFREAGLLKWLELGHARPWLFVTNGDEMKEPKWFRMVRYDVAHPRALRMRHCFSRALVSMATTHGADLLFLRSSASRVKRQAWREYRNLWMRHHCGDRCKGALHGLLGTRRPLPMSHCGTDSAGLPLASSPLITVLYRTTTPGTSASGLVASGRGRRITNRGELVRALQRIGRVQEVDPGSLPIWKQQRLMAQVCGGWCTAGCVACARIFTPWRAARNHPARCHWPCSGASASLPSLYPINLT
jgi:hypothetical protein